jgi:hypothetical protein
MASQATLLRAVFPPGLTMEQLAARAALKAPTAGATEVLRFLRHHLSKCVRPARERGGGSCAYKAVQPRVSLTGCPAHRVGLVRTMLCSTRQLQSRRKLAERWCGASSSLSQADH